MSVCMDGVGGERWGAQQGLGRIPNKKRPNLERHTPFSAAARFRHGPQCSARFRSGSRLGVAPSSATSPYAWAMMAIACPIHACVGFSRIRRLTRSSVEALIDSSARSAIDLLRE